MNKVEGLISKVDEAIAKDLCSAFETERDLYVREKCLSDHTTDSSCVDRERKNYREILNKQQKNVANLMVSLEEEALNQGKMLFGQQALENSYCANFDDSLRSLDPSLFQGAGPELMEGDEDKLGIDL